MPVLKDGSAGRRTVNAALLAGRVVRKRLSFHKLMTNGEGDRDTIGDVIVEALGCLNFFVAAWHGAAGQTAQRRN